MAGAEPEERIRVPFLYHSWRDVTFLHWRYPPDTIGDLLPAGLRPHVRDGWAWVGLTPFRVEGFRLPFTPAVPGVANFPETNLRTYVIGPDETDGLWFFTLEAESIPTVAAARLGLNVPYRWADMRVEVDGDRLTYLSRRREGDRSARHRIVVDRGRPIDQPDPTALDHWLTGRWRAWTKKAGRWLDVPVEHQPWPLHRADVVVLEETLVAGSGLPPPDDLPLVHFSPGVDVAFGRPRLHC